MNLITPLFLSIGLSADAFAVSVTNGICSKKINRKCALTTSLIFGGFQGLMPLLGYYLGNFCYDFILLYQNWVALILLGAIGINMILDGIRESKNCETRKNSNNIFTAKNLVLQGIATSIDALAAGVGLIVMDLPIIPSSLLIGSITFIFCFLGVHLGNKFGNILGQRAKFTGGIILIIIACKAFF